MINAMKIRNWKLEISLIGLLFVFLPLTAHAQFLGQIVKFSIDSSYDASQREEIPAVLVKISTQTLIYVDDAWWGSQNPFAQQQAKLAFDALATEFEEKIYSALTSNFGSEWKPGIDGDERLTVLFHPMKEGAGGYTNYGDEFPKVQNPSSNEREMVYLNASFVAGGVNSLKTLLAHEFVHLITFYQKEKLRGVKEETWLNEARAEYASTLLGYDDMSEGSNLQKRMKVFIASPSDPLIEWNNEKQDYGVANMFSQYLADQYGFQILRDSLQSKEVGAISLPAFPDIFRDWILAVFLNDCALGPRYCYKNPIKNFDFFITLSRSSG